MKREPLNLLPHDCEVAVFEPSSGQIGVRRIAIPALGEDEILVRVECCSLCGSDLHTVSGRRHCSGPTILGHEIVGRIAAFGTRAKSPVDASGKSLSIGDRVTWSIVVGCGDCFFCGAGLPQKCERLFKYGHSSLEHPHPLSGGLAEYCVLVPGTQIFRLPDTLPLMLAATCNCAVATAAAAVRVGGDITGRSVLVMGGGLLGLMAAAICKKNSASSVVLCDLRADRRAQALRFGADEACDLEQVKDDAYGLKQRRSEGRGFDVAIDMVGQPEVVQAAASAVRIGGCVVLVGAVFPVGDLLLDLQILVRRMIRLEGMHNYGPQDIQAGLEFLIACCDLYPWAELFSTPYGLRDVRAAFEQATIGAKARTIICPHPPEPPNE